MPTCTASTSCCPTSPGCARTPTGSSACVATHGHEDHVGALHYLLRELQFPIYGSAVTLGLARNRIEEAGLLGRTELITVADGERRMIGPFDVEFIPVTHSVPHAHAIAVHTPQGVILHSGDFKLDLTPVDGRRTDLARIGTIATDRGHPAAAGRLDERRGARLRPERDLRRRRAAPAVPRAGRPADHHGQLRQPPPPHPADRRRRDRLGPGRRHARAVDQEERADGPRPRCAAHPGRRRSSTSRRSTGYEPGQVCVISTGSQGEPMSALSLLARGENRFVKVGEHDTVILSSHAIPGNEGNVNRVIDGLLRAGVEVIHSGIADVHATGHAQADELKTYLLARPAPSGSCRSTASTATSWPTPGSAELMGVPARPRPGVRGRRRADARRRRRWPRPAGCRPATCTSTASSATSARACSATAGCWPRRAWSSSSSPSTSRRGKVLTGPEIITRGWVYAPEAEDLLDEACDAVAAAVETALAAGRARRRRRSSATCAAPPASSSTSAPRAAR